MDTQLLDAAGWTAVSTYLVSIAKPFLETYIPFARDGGPTHDAAIRALSLLINLVLVVMQSIGTGTLHATSPAVLVIQALAQTGGAHVLYSVTKHDDPAVPATPAPLP
jgi:hypothetical protein